MNLYNKKINEKIYIIELQCGGNVNNFLESLGFISGTKIKIVSKLGSNLIVEVRNTRIALCNNVAKKILVN
jgi:ferrous iron transport protein A